jgi:hypothetical protein
MGIPSHGIFGVAAEVSVSCVVVIVPENVDGVTEANVHSS